MHGWENQQSRMYKSVIKRTIAITQGKKKQTFIETDYWTLFICTEGGLCMAITEIQL